MADKKKADKQAKAKASKAKTDKTDAHTGARKTEANKKAILKFLHETGDFITTACEKLSLSRAQFYTWLDTDPDFAQAYNDIKERHIDLMESDLVYLANNAERQSDRIKAKEIWLKAKAKHRGYGVERREQEHSGAIQTEPIVIQLPDNGRRTYTDDE